MTAVVRSGDVGRFRTIIARRLGLDFDDAKLSFLAEVLGRRAGSNGGAAEDYVRSLDSEASTREISALAQELTVGETYFFRNRDHYRALDEVVLPERMRAQATRRRLRILSAGCASGEEPYSLAILVRDSVTDPSWDVSILGVDVNPEALARARRARFSSWSLRETPPDFRRRWFRPDGRDLVLDEAARAQVRFEERNLAEDDPGLWQPAAYDVVFCRNVIMYFTREIAAAVVARVSRALAPGGYLFLGHAETLRGLSHDFHLRHTHGTFYYQLRGDTDVAARREPITAPTQMLAQWALPAAVEATDSWVDAIRGAAARIQTLTESREEPVPSSNVRPSWDLGLTLELLRKERFEEALELVRALPAESARDPDVRLLEAVLLTHSGQLELAEDACKRLLELDELSAGAHYLLALCREGGGDRDGAVEHDQVALYLDPGFAMPRLHLGLLARRAGAFGTAKEELGQALALLEREEASRLLLFGGGFGREALIALCRAELATCGGPA